MKHFLNSNLVFPFILFLYLFFITMLLYLGCTVIFTKVLTMYYS
jgi:hypothetical protein